ncbi:hypothetical protein FEM48_ZijujUnG0090600 [Ziziphus jujuba var. spinosa]|uniref:Disease resistance protein winged helix domain-containing protein n=1 Tax=Ziziphus jujuba var. spinosa TaxID=714518 RepID=A0A978U8I5_ZIZJJ|nr:hypothetical protein FEM48_ZijujUnG0090600 [Ziziphus jujuba var. spinosa]
MDVPNFCKISPSFRVHELQRLRDDNPWKLFCKKVFQPDCAGQCPPHLEQLSHKIVDKCEGLPLAIVAIAGLLSTKKKTTVEWQKLHNSLSSELDSNLHLRIIMKILSLSYFDLPYHLKSCFLYFGMYPEDYSIRCSRLIRQWIAEGFVNQKKDKTLEEVALEYLTELIHRNLVQVSWVDLKGRIRTCRIHDLLREHFLKMLPLPPAPPQTPPFSTPPQRHATSVSLHQIIISKPAIDLATTVPEKPNSGTEKLIKHTILRQTQPCKTNPLIRCGAIFRLLFSSSFSLEL